MWRRFIEFIRRLFSNEKRSISLLTDEEVEREVKKKEENLRLLHEIVGESPLDQIDWIIENGYDKYHEKYKSYEDGSIQREEKKKVLNNVGHFVYNPSFSGCIKGAVEEKEKHFHVDLDTATRFHNIDKSTGNNLLEDNLILCKSLAHGKFVYTSKITGKVFTWEGNKDIVYMPEEEFVHLKRNSLLSSFIEQVDVVEHIKEHTKEEDVLRGGYGNKPLIGWRSSLSAKGYVLVEQGNANRDKVYSAYGDIFN